MVPNMLLQLTETLEVTRYAEQPRMLAARRLGRTIQWVRTFPCRSYRPGAASTFLDADATATSQVDEINVLVGRGAAEVDDEVRVLDRRTGEELRGRHRVIEVRRDPGRPDTLVCQVAT